MGRSSKVTRVCAGVAALLLAFACSGCQNAVQEEPSADDMVESALSSAGIDVADVAAVASGRIITQQDVEDAIAAERVRYGFEGDASWNSYLESAGLSEHDVWAVTVKSMVDNALVEAEAERLGIDVSDRVARRVESVASLYPSRAAFIEALADKGYTEESYTDAVSHNLLWDALRDEVVSDPEPTDEQIRQYAEVVAPTLTGRRSSHILFASDDYATALDVLEQIEAGADFATLAAEYSIDSTAADGGDVGWDSLNTFVPAYQQALDVLEVGEVSGIVRSSFGYHIIMCTDKYDAPTGEDGAIDIDAIPDDLMDAIVQAMRESLSTQLFDQYIDHLEATAPIAVFDKGGVQISLSDVGLCEDDPIKVDDVDEAMAEVQAEVQDAVDQGVSVVKLSAAALSSGEGDGTSTDGATSAASGPVKETELDPVEASAADPAGSAVAPKADADAGDARDADDADAGAGEESAADEG